MKTTRLTSTLLAANIAFGDSLYATSADLDAALDREARKSRWLRKKARK